MFEVAGTSALLKRINDEKESLANMSLCQDPLILAAVDCEAIKQAEYRSWYLSMTSVQ